MGDALAKVLMMRMQFPVLYAICCSFKSFFHYNIINTENSKYYADALNVK